MVAYQVNGSLTERNLAAARWRKLVKEMPGRQLTQPGYARADGILNGHIAGPDPQSRAASDQLGPQSDQLSPEKVTIPASQGQRIRPAPANPGRTEPGRTKPGPTKPGPTKPGPTEPGPTKPGPTKPGPTKPRGANHLSRPEPPSPTEAFHPLDTFLLEHPGDEGRPPHGFS
jgi:hypothetical protein